MHIPPPFPDPSLSWASPLNPFGADEALRHRPLNQPRKLRAQLRGRNLLALGPMRDGDADVISEQQQPVLALAQPVRNALHGRPPISSSNIAAHWLGKRALTALFIGNQRLAVGYNITTLPTWSKRWPQHLRYSGRKRTHDADVFMSELVAQRLVAHLRLSGFVVFKRPPVSGYARADRGTPTAREYRDE
jgi:hypothetical protein